MNITVNREKLKEHLEIVRIPGYRRPNSIAQFTTDVICDYYGVDPRRINQGYCFIWAYLFWTLAKDKMEVRFKSNYNHVVVHTGGRFYDSEHINGMSELSKMPFFEARRALEADDYNIVEMAQYWASNGLQAHKFRGLMRVSARNLYRKAIGA